MRITIVVPDNVVIVDGIRHDVDCASLAGIHALQWYGDAGDVEFDLVDGEKKPNQAVDSLDRFQSVLSGLT